LGDTTYTFGVSGDLYNSNLLLFDRNTDSRWLQLTGIAVEGKLAGTRLKAYPVAYDSWRAWREHHPDGKVLGIPHEFASRFGSYDDNPYAGYDYVPGVWFYVNHLDAQLPRKERVIGVEVRGTFKAYPEASFWTKTATQDRLGDVDVTILADRTSSRIGVFPRGTHAFTFQDGIVRDERDRTWSWDGNELRSGDEVLESFPAIPTFWFAWAAMHPDTKVYKP
jgi:hypothetical protein